MTKTAAKILSGTLLSVGLLGTNVNADDFVFNTKSLIGIEGGYTHFQVENQDVDPLTPLNKSYDKGEVGFKIGAEGEHYRVFLSIHNYFVGNEFDRLMTYGGEVQYLFNFSKKVNFFIGGNVGKLYGKFQADNENFNREFNDLYYGGDTGFNIHLNPTFDLELAARYITTKAKSDKYGVTYKIDSLPTAYASVIIKFQID